MNQPLARIVYTGGPCGGKTTALSRSSVYFSKAGYRVILIPEIATLLINGGMKPSEIEVASFQQTIFNLTLAFEEETKRLAGTFSDRPVLILSDRGLLDGKAYCSDIVWEKLLSKNGLSESQLSDRYEGVIHLVTAAENAPTYYSRVSNPARQEEAELAISLDHRLRAAWHGHPHLHLIDNSTNFEGKMARTLATVLDLLKRP